jgi:hypothetical protein
MFSNWVYNYPSIDKQVEVLLSLHSGNSIHSDDGDHLPAQVAKYLAMIDKTSLSDSSSTPQHGPRVVLLTGSTGSLGSHILSNLIGDGSVEAVYCINRRVSNQPLEVRQKDAFERVGLDTQQLESEKIVLLEADMSVKDTFDLDESTVEKVVCYAPPG